MLNFKLVQTEVPKHQLDLAEPLVDQNGTPRLEHKMLDIIKDEREKSVSARRVLFCGEATHPDSYSTVHGARQTGLREAAR